MKNNSMEDGGITIMKINSMERAYSLAGSAVAELVRVVEQDFESRRDVNSVASRLLADDLAVIRKRLAEGTYRRQEREIAHVIASVIEKMARALLSLNPPPVKRGTSVAFSLRKGRGNDTGSKREAGCEKARNYTQYVNALYITAYRIAGSTVVDFAAGDKLESRDTEEKASGALAGQIAATRYAKEKLGKQFVDTELATASKIDGAVFEANRQAEQLIDAHWSVVHEVALELIYLAGFIAR